MIEIGPQRFEFLVAEADESVVEQFGGDFRPHRIWRALVTATTQSYSRESCFSVPGF